MVFVALLAAIICVLAPLSVPVGLVPISLGSFAVYLAATLTNRKIGTAAVLLYVLLGAVGTPVFAGWTGGFARLAGPTGGFILGYIPCAYVIGLLTDKLESHKWSFPVAMVAGTVILYAFGLAWFMIATKNDFLYSFAACVTKFLPGDALKIVAATAVVIPVRGQIKKLFLRKMERSL